MRLRRPSPAGTIAVMALVIALGGTAVAADRYIITSTAQIKPSVLRELRSDANAHASVLARAGAHAVRARARSVGPVTSGTAQTADPMNGGTWSQLAEELNQLAIQVTLKRPASSTCTEGSGPPFPGELRMSILEDGVPVAYVQSFASGAEVTETLSQQTLWLPEPGHTTTRNLTAQVSDGCGAGGGKGGGHFAINSLSIDVIGVR